MRVRRAPGVGPARVRAGIALCAAGVCVVGLRGGAPPRPSIAGCCGCGDLTVVGVVM